MTAHRPRQEASLIEILFAGAPTTRAGWLGGVWRPATDVYETEDAIVVQVEIAGVQQSDFVVALHDRRLTISGVRYDRGRAATRAYHQMEVHFGDFRTEVELSGPVDERRIDAEYSNGFLSITLPKLRPQSVQITE